MARIGRNLSQSVVSCMLSKQVTLCVHVHCGLFALLVAGTLTSIHRAAECYNKRLCKQSTSDCQQENIIVHADARYMYYATYC